MIFSLTLLESELDPDPIKQFAKWFAAAKAESGMLYPNAVCLSTVTAGGCPDGRIVLLRGFDEAGFIFYTNSESSKGRALAHLARAAMTFYWDKLQRQVRIRGSVEHVSDAQADAYFAGRPRESQLGAWASDQSMPLADRGVFEERLKEVTARFDGAQVPRPPHWTGYRLQPEEIEFWQERLFRLHDRFLYTRAEGAWSRKRLYP